LVEPVETLVVRVPGTVTGSRPARRGFAGSAAGLARPSWP